MIKLPTFEEFKANKYLNEDYKNLNTDIKKKLESKYGKDSENIYNKIKNSKNTFLEDAKEFGIDINTIKMIKIDWIEKYKTDLNNILDDIKTKITKSNLSEDTLKDFINIQKSFLNKVK